jgi:hypothetical protein
LFTTKIVFVAVGSDPGKLPLAKVDGLPFANVRAGHVVGSGGGGVCAIRNTYGLLLAAPL